MKLCFGTFGTVLKRCTGHTDKELIGTMALIIDPFSRYAVDDKRGKAAISKLLNCKIDFVDTSDNPKKKKEVAEEFESKVISFFNSDGILRVVLALLDIIYNDSDIENHYEFTFAECFGTDKRSFLTQCGFVFSDFLASTLLYTIKRRGNMDELAHKAITNDYLDNLVKEYKDNIQKKPDFIKIIIFPTAQIIGIFEQAVKERRIDKFIYCDPTLKINADLIYEADHFVSTLNNVIDKLEYENDIHQSISLFIDLLYEYQSYLSKNMLPEFCPKFLLEGDVCPMRTTGNYVPKFREENINGAKTFERKTLDYRNRICLLYKEIIEKSNGDIAVTPK